MNVLQVVDIKKSFDESEILKGVTFDLRRSEIYGLLGPNGAGKTTTINILLGLLKQTSGQIKIGEGNIEAPYSEPIKKKLGYIPDEPILMQWLNSVENMELTAHLYKTKISKQQIDKYLKEFGLFEKKDILVRDFSKGMKQKLMLAMQLIHNPDIIIMDEPTTGLDPVSNNQLKSIVKKYREQGKSIIISSHDMSFAENLCDRVGIIINGKIRMEGTIQEILTYTETINLEEAVVKVLESNIYWG